MPSIPPTGPKSTPSPEPQKPQFKETVKATHNALNHFRKMTEEFMKHPGKIDDPKQLQAYQKAIEALNDAGNKAQNLTKEA